MHKINKKVSAPVHNKHLQSTMPFKCVFVVVVVVIHFSRPWGKFIVNTLCETARVTITKNNLPYLYCS